MQWLIDVVLESLKGIIVAWSGLIADIPEGWAFCDGTNGTPDLRVKFIRGARLPLAPPGAVGGEVWHDHTLTTDGHAHNLADHTHGFTGDGHNHDITGGTDIQAGTGYDSLTVTDQAMGTTDSDGNQPDAATDTATTELATNNPPFYTLAYIMKL